MNKRMYAKLAPHSPAPTSARVDTRDCGISFEKVTDVVDQRMPWGLARFWQYLFIYVMLANIYPWSLLIVWSSHPFQSWISKYFYNFQLPPPACCYSLYNLSKPKVRTMNYIIAYDTLQELLPILTSVQEVQQLCNRISSLQSCLL